MSNSDFLQKGNISMLWDVISDEEIFKFLPRDLQLNVSQMFINNVNGFFEVERKKTNNLIEINKKYIILILNHIKNNFQKKPHNKIKILEDEPVKEIITYEEIHNERKSQFEKDLAKRGPTSESNWVLKDKLIVGSYPGDENDKENEKYLTQILNCGVTIFACLQHEYDNETPEEVWRNRFGLRPYFKDAEKMITNKENHNLKRT